MSIFAPTRPKRRRPLPEDFTEKAANLSVKQARKYWRTSEIVLRRWYRESGITTRRKRGRPPPSDFAEVASRLHRKGLLRHYKVGCKRLQSWIMETGINPVTMTQSEAAHLRWADHVPKVKKPVKRQANRVPVSNLVLTAPKDSRLDTRAADYLRHWATVYRCWATGTAHYKGDCWRYGLVILSPAELISKARAKGFDPDAWKALAA